MIFLKKFKRLILRSRQTATKATLKHKPIMQTVNLLLTNRTFDSGFMIMVEWSIVHDKGSLLEISLLLLLLHLILTIP